MNTCDQKLISVVIITSLNILCIQFIFCSSWSTISCSRCWSLSNRYHCNCSRLWWSITVARRHCIVRYHS